MTRAGGMRNGVVVGGGLCAAALCVPVALSPERSGVQTAGIAAVAVVAVLVAVGLTAPARVAGWFAVPALLLGWSWWRQTTWFAYSLVGGTSIGGLPHHPKVDLSGSPGLSIPVALPALVAVLWALATVGLITVTRVPGGSAVRALAVVAAVLTVPLWVAPAARMTTAGAALGSTSVPAQAHAAQLGSLALVLVVGCAVLATRAPRPARSAAYAVPAAGLTWACLQGALGYGYAGVGVTGGPSFVDTLPWVVVTLSQVGLVVVLGVLTFLGARVLVARYRPPDVVAVSPSGR